jgi:ABC-type molybdenum transport system ATPase subunit/photorepair protein PhrA
MNRGLRLLRASAVHGGRPLFRDIDLSVRAGEATAIVGPTGAGKTAILAAVTGGDGGAATFETSGAFLLDGEPISATWHAHAIRFRPEDLLRPIDDVFAAHRREALETLKLKDFFGDGSRPVVALSPLELRLSLLVGAAIARPAAITLDEPTFALKREDTSVYLGALRQLARVVPVLFATRTEAAAKQLGARTTHVDRGFVVVGTAFRRCESALPPAMTTAAPPISALPPVATLPDGPRRRDTSAFPPADDPDPERSRHVRLGAAARLSGRSAAFFVAPRPPRPFHKEGTRRSPSP